jgi:thioredoxin family protein
VKSAPMLKLNYDQTKKDHEDFEMVSLSLDDSDRGVREFVAKQELSWPQIRIGTASKLAADYAVEGLPHYVLVGRDGVILHDGSGGEKLAQVVNKILGDR